MNEGSDTDETNSTPTQTRQEVTASHPWIALGLLCAVFMMDQVDFSIIQVALPTLQRTLGFTEFGLQWVVTIYVLMFGGFMLLGGRAADIYGRRRLFLGGVALFAVGSLLAGLAPTPTLLLGGRALQGLGAAVTTPAGISIITNIFPEGPKRNRALAVYAAVAAGGFSVGLVLGGIITNFLGWRWIFLINPPIAAVILALGPRFIPPSRSPEETRFDILGAVTITGGLLAGVYAITESITLGWTDPRIGGTAAASVILLGGFVVHERQTRDPLIPLDLFQPKVIKMADIITAILGASAVTMLFFTTQYLQSVLNQNALWTGLALLPIGLAIVVVSTQMSEPLVNRYGLRPVLVVGLGIHAAGAGYLSLLPIDGTYWVAVFPGITVMAVGFGLAYPAATIGAVTDIDEHWHGLASGLQQTAYQIGAGVGLALYVTIATLLTAFGGTEVASGAAAFVNGFNIAMVADTAVVGAAALAALTLRPGIAAESTTTETGRDDQEPVPESTD